MKTTALSISLLFTVAVIGTLLPSCEGLTLTAVTPYGDVSSSNGKTTIIARPIVIREK